MAKKDDAWWSEARAARVAASDPNNPNEGWYQMLLDLAHNCYPKMTVAQVHEYVDALLRQHGANVIEDKTAAGGIRVLGYTHDIHADVAQYIANPPDPDAPKEGGIFLAFDPALIKSNYQAVARAKELGMDPERIRDAWTKAYDAADCSAQNPGPQARYERMCAILNQQCEARYGDTAPGKATTPEGGREIPATIAIEGSDDAAKSLFSLGYGAPGPDVDDIDTSSEPVEESEEFEHDPKSASGATAPDAGTASESEKSSTDEVQSMTAVCGECGTVLEPSDEPCDEPQCNPEWCPVCETTWHDHDVDDDDLEAVDEQRPVDIKERSYEPEVLDDECEEAADHMEGVQCLLCSWTGTPGVGATLNRSTTIEEVYEQRRALLDKSSGEVELLEFEECLQQAGVAFPVAFNNVKEFAIVDDATADWYIGLIRGIQLKIGEHATQFAKLVGTALNVMRSLSYKYDGQLAAWGATKLPTYKRGEKAGQYRAKNHRTMNGAIFFTKTGGTKIFNRGAVQKFIDEIPESDFEKYGVKLVRKYSSQKVIEAVENGENIPGVQVDIAHTLGSVTVGGEKKWSWGGERKRLTTRIKALELKTLGEIGSNESEDGDDGDDE